MKNFFKNKKNLIVIFVLFISLFFAKSIFSGTNDNFFGFGWAANYLDLNYNGSIDLPEEDKSGAGWISFNCINEPGSCNSGGNYGVKISQVGEEFFVTGFAWSHNFGWLKFGGLSGFPEENGENAYFEGSYENGVFNGTIYGWARFCSPASNPDTCGGFFTNDQNGGWDGWVKLTGSNHALNIENNVLSGYAWGGFDEHKNNVGWIDMNGILIQDNQTNIDFYAQPAFASAPDFETTLYWNPIDPSIVFTECIANSSNPLNEETVPEWDGQVSFTTPASLTVSTPYNPTNYQITCFDGVGTEYTSTISVARNVGESLTLNNSRVINGATTLSWRATNILGDSCNASTVNPSSGLNWSDNNPKTPPTEADQNPTVFGSMTGVSVTAVLPAKTTYRLTCLGKYSLSPIVVSLDLHTQSGASSLTSVPKYREN